MTTATTAQPDTFTVEYSGAVAVFRFPRTPLYFSSNLAARDQLLAAFASADGDPMIRVIVLCGFPEKAGSTEYAEFFRKNLGQAHWLHIHRMLNAFNQFIEAIVGSRKFVLFADRGAVISQFINVSLACDYRIVADNTVIQKAYLNHRMLPKGGGAFFLTQLLGRSRALALLASPDELTAEQALALGIVDEIAPLADLDHAALAAAERFAAVPQSTLAGLKRLVNYSLSGLTEYLQFENDQILRILRDADFTEH